MSATNRTYLQTFENVITMRIHFQVTMKIMFPALHGLCSHETNNTIPNFISRHDTEMREIYAPDCSK
jgi:hypothetical protein